MEYFFTSNFPLKGNENINKFIKNNSKNKALNIVLISALNQDNGLKKYKNHFFDYGFEDVEYFKIDKEIGRKEMDYLNTFDMFYLLGGDPLKMKQKMQKSGFEKFLQNLKNEDKIMISTSGSSMVLSDDFSLLYTFYPKAKKKLSKDQSTTLSGFALFPHTVLPHFNRYNKKGQLEIIKEFSITNNQIVYALYDGCALRYVKNKIESIGNIIIFEDGREKF